jgi:hypothetical protein
MDMGSVKSIAELFAGPCPIPFPQQAQPSCVEVIAVAGQGWSGVIRLQYPYKGCKRGASQSRKGDETGCPRGSQRGQSCPDRI